MKKPAQRDSLSRVGPSSVWRAWRFIWLFFALPAACKHQYETREVISYEERSEGKTAVLVSKGMGGSGATESAVRDGNTHPSSTIQLGIDPESGKSSKELRLSLVYMPTPKPGATSLPTCLSPFSPETEIGLVVCEDGRTTQIPLFARDVRQICREIDGRDQSAVSLPVFPLPGCRRIKASLYVFEPRLRLETGP